MEKENEKGSQKKDKSNVINLLFLSKDAGFIPKFVDKHIPPTFQGWCPPLLWGDIRIKHDFQFKGKSYSLVVTYAYPGEELTFLKDYFFIYSNVIMFYNVLSFHSVFYVKEYINQLNFKNELRNNTKNNIKNKLEKKLFMLIEYKGQIKEESVNEHILQQEIKKIKQDLFKQNVSFCTLTGDITDKEFKESVIDKFFEFSEDLESQYRLNSENHLELENKSKDGKKITNEVCFSILSYSDDVNDIKNLFKKYLMFKQTNEYFLKDKNVELLNYQFKDLIAYIDVHLPKKGLEKEFLKKSFLITEFQIQLYLYKHKNIRSQAEVKERIKKFLYWKDLEDYSYNTNKRKNFLLVVIEVNKDKKLNKFHDNKLEQELKETLVEKDVDFLFLKGDIRNNEFTDYVLEEIVTFHQNLEFIIDKN